MAEEAEDGYSGLGPDVDLSVDDDWGYVLVAVAEGVAGRGCLIAAAAILLFSLLKRCP